MVSASSQQKYPVGWQAVTGETFGETYGETFGHGLPMQIPFVQSTFGRLWGDGDIIFFIPPNLYLLFLWHIKIIS